MLVIVTRLYSVESPAGYLTVTNRDEMLSPRRDSDAIESGGWPYDGNPFRSMLTSETYINGIFRSVCDD
jgi:hypothetical protein